MLEKTFQPADIEGPIYERWQKSGAFKAGRHVHTGNSDSGKPADPYCIVIPPPNVTGSLHMGHALNNTLQDVLIRFERMRGKDVLWQPGIDHAGIATQSLVEKQLAQRQQPDRRAMGRDAFIKRVWEWKEESGGMIFRQLRRLGASCDWDRERFTLGEKGAPEDQMVRAVTRTFVDLYRAGLIYKDKRLVNWDPKLLTAISDLEVVSVDKQGSFKWSSADKTEDGTPKPFDKAAFNKIIDRDPHGHLYYFRYPLTKKVAGYKLDYIVVATTRPETMLGDTAVAVHPDDKRYKKALAGKATIKLPLVGREIPLVGDEYADPEQGSGAVKITPAHDENDFEVGLRHGLPKINIFDERARLNNEVPEKYRGLDRFEARKQVVADLEALGLLEKIEPHANKVPHGDRSDAAIEPWLTDQWYVNAAEMAKEAIAAVEDGRTKFVPQNWEKTYFEWMRNIKPWCISRQLWWGHRIPALCGPRQGAKGLEYSTVGDHENFVAASEEERIGLVEKFYGKKARIVVDASAAMAGAMHQAAGMHTSDEVIVWHDPDVLDTWFSSALWPFSTLGWPDTTPQLSRYYPTSTLLTGFDIIFFWVARMMMMGLHFMKDVPFDTVYVHALVRDEKGQKMSKSKGNVMDPLDIVDGVDLDTLIRKRTGDLAPGEAAKIASETKKAFPNGIPAYGADALRFTLAAMAAQGRDIKLSMSVIEGYRNFATKIWNAARFGEMNGCMPQAGFDPAAAKQTLNRWIAGETQRVAAAVTAGIEGHRYNEAASSLYHFVWHSFCDWYIELAKPALTGPDGAAKDETRAMFAWVFDRILTLLHPFMPFITEALWDRTGDAAPRPAMLIVTPWPELSGLEDKAADEEMSWIINLIEEVRSVRSEMNVPPAAKLPLVVVGASKIIRERLERHVDTVSRLARLDKIDFAKVAPKGALQIVTREAVLALPIADIIDVAAESERLKREISKMRGEIEKLDLKLADEKFTARAPEHVVEENRERRSQADAAATRLQEALKRLEAAH